MASKHRKSDRETAMRPGLRRLVRGLTALAMVISAYLAWVSFTGRNAVGCGPDSGCQQVLNSRWAYWFGIPVSLFGLLAYTAVFAGTFRLGSRAPAAQQRQIWQVMLPCAILMAGGALWFAGIQWLVIKTFCPYCMTTHGAALAAALIVLFHVPFAAEPEKPWQKEKQVYLPPRPARRLVLSGVAGLVLFAAGQIAHQPKSFLVRSGGGATGVEGDAQTGRLLQLFDGRVELNLADVPIRGNPAAANVMVELHDYTCKGCQTMHKPLLDLEHAFSNELAIVSLPMPLDSACNHNVKTTPRLHTNACEYARIGLALWQTQPAALAAFDDWIFNHPTWASGSKQPPHLSEAQQFAEKLIGPAALANARQNPRIDSLLEKSVAIYTLNLQLNQAGSMPQFIIGTNAYFGSLKPEDLFQKVTNQYALRRSPP